MGRIVFAPYKLRVSAARELARRFDSFCIMPTGSRFRASEEDIIVNWGRSDLPDYQRGRVLNNPRSVALAVNKIASFERFLDARVPTVVWTTDPNIAQNWLSNGDTVVHRATATGRGGVGIRIYEPGQPLATRAYDSALFTIYFKRKDEYRVHVVNGAAISVQQKRKRRGMDCDFRVRSYDNGWVFCRSDVAAPKKVIDAAIQAVSALGLDFGGVDVGYNAHHDRAAVFEVNSAPGIEGTTLEDYYNAFQEIRQA